MPSTQTVGSPTLPSSVQSQLAATRRKLRFIDVALGLARAVVALALALVVVFALDTTLEPPLAVVRAFALFCGVVAAAACTVVLGRPLRRRLTDDHVALMVEDEYPQLGDSLVSAVQLSREIDRTDVYTSKTLIRSTIDQAAKEASTLDFGRVVSYAPLVPLWTLIAAFLALGGLLSTNPTTSAYASTFVRRVAFGQDLTYPKLVALHVGRPTLVGATFDATVPTDPPRVAEITPRSPADEAGLQPGDRVVAIEGESVKDYPTLMGALLQHYAGDEVAVTLERGGQSVELTGVVGTNVAQAVAKGDDLAIDVFVTKGVDEVASLQIHTRYEGGEEEVRDLLQIGRGHYRKTYQNVTNSFSFFVEDDDHGVRSGKYAVQVVQRPRVEHYAFVLDYPDYTAKATETLRQPDLQVPMRTDLAYVVVTNKPLDTGELVLESEAMVNDPDTGKRQRVITTTLGADVGKAPVLLEDTSPAGLEAAGYGHLAEALAGLGLEDEDLDQRVLVGAFKVESDVRFSFDLFSTEGYGSGKKPVSFNVRAVADRRPVVSIPKPGRRKQVTPGAKVPIQIDARDDYGIRDIVLRMRPETPGETSPQSVQERELEGVEIGSREVSLNLKIDLADQRLQPGEKLHYWAVAFDQNEDPERSFKESQEYEISVVRPEDLERILQDRLAALKEQLETAGREQAEARAQAESFVGELAPKAVLTEDDKRRLQRVGYEQRRVTSRLEDIGKELADLEEERRLNRLDDESSMFLLKDLGEGVNELAERHSPVVLRELEDARAAVQLDEQVKAKIGRIPDLQYDIEETIKALAARIDKWGDFTEVIQEWRDLKKDQNRVLEGTREAVKTRMGGNR